MSLDYDQSISLYAIEQPTDVFNQPKAEGRLRDWQNVHLILYQATDQDQDECRSSSSEED